MNPLPPWSPNACKLDSCASQLISIRLASCRLEARDEAADPVPGQLCHDGPCSRVAPGTLRVHDQVRHVQPCYYPPRSGLLNGTDRAAVWSPVLSGSSLPEAHGARSTSRPTPSSTCYPLVRKPAAVSMLPCRVTRSTAASWRADPPFVAVSCLRAAARGNAKKDTHVNIEETG